MKTNNRNRTLFHLLALALLLGGAALAQDKPRERKLSLGGQDLTGKSDGLEIQVLKEVNGAWKLVDQKEEFKAGDKVRVQFWSNLKGYIYFVNIPPKANQRVLYSQEIEKDRDYTLPGRKANKELWFEFDNEKGTEVLKLVMSPSPIKVFDEALKKSDGELGESVFSVTDELAAGSQGGQGGKPKYEEVAIVRPKSSGCPQSRDINLRCRSVGFEPPDPKSGKGAVVVAIPDDKSSSGKLGKDEAIVVEIRLKHI
jgi:hypothetical protein